LKQSYVFETIQMSERKSVNLDGLGDDSVVDILFGRETDFVGQATFDLILQLALKLLRRF
jgi:hypothetical protein